MSILKTIRNAIKQSILRTKLKKSNYIGKNVLFSSDTFIGKHCRIGDNVCFGPKVVLGDYVSIGKGALLERIEVGDHTVVEGQIILTGHGDGKIKIGKQSFVGHLTVLDFSDDITMGDYVHIGYSYFWTHSSVKHALNGIDIEVTDDRYRPRAPIVIEDNVYIGVHSTIYPGTRIGHHSVIAPNSAVVKDVEPYSLVGGVPARFIKSTHEMLIKK
jgi:acetyltransferase-like isoleucine patch superfamily enzyme